MEIFRYIYNFCHFFFNIFRQFTVLTISSSVFIQIIWFLAHFEGSLKYYQRLVRTEVNWSFKTSLFAVFLFRKTRTAGPVFSGLFQSGLGLGSVSRPDLQTLEPNWICSTNAANFSQEAMNYGMWDIAWLLEQWVCAKTKGSHTVETLSAMQKECSAIINGTLSRYSISRCFYLT